MKIVGEIMKIKVIFKTKRSIDENIMPKQKVEFNGVCGSIIQTKDSFIVSLKGDTERTKEVLRYIWEMSFLYDGYFYTPCKYTRDGVDENVEQLYFLDYYVTGRTWKDFASSLVGANKDFSKERISEYRVFRNSGRDSGDLKNVLINSFYYLHSCSYEKINANHRLSLLLNHCDGFVINTSADNKNIKDKIKEVIETTLDTSAVNYGANLLGVDASDLYDVLGKERNEIDHYKFKVGSLSDYAHKLKTKTSDYIIWYFTYVIELALRIAFLKYIGCTCDEKMVENALNGINDWIILKCNLEEKCKNLINQIRQAFNN